jgi:hypothetical protein
MKANSSGNRISGATYSHQSHDRAEARDHSSSPAGEPRRAYEREQFVHHQQDLARRALHLGSPGAARAALRALYGTDFADSTRAMELMRTLRDPMAPPDEVMQAVRALIQLQPVGADRPRMGSERLRALDRDDVSLDGD